LAKPLWETVQQNLVKLEDMDRWPTSSTPRYKFWKTFCTYTSGDMSSHVHHSTVCYSHNSEITHISTSVIKVVQPYNKIIAMKWKNCKNASHK